MWVSGRRLRPEAETAAALVAAADRDGLDRGAYDAGGLRRKLAAARSGNPAALAQAELALSTAVSDYLADLHRAPASAAPQFWDPAVPLPPITPAQALDALAGPGGLAAKLAALQRMHPIYAALRDALAADRAAHPGGSPRQDLILANMARARALPADPGRRYVLVDAAAQRLWLYEDGRPVDSMRVIVGRADNQTPTLTGLIRYADFRPYWNIPPDIVAKEIAPHVLREGPGYLARQDLEALSDWSPQARVLDPAEVDWSAVAAGAQELRMRRRPGATNILGQVKLMLPNTLGIYLHDTPDKSPFSRAQRTISHGCIRLEHAMRLTRALVGPAADNPPPGDDVRVDLPKPVPVYVLYLTLAPGPDGLEARRDVYGRDAPLIATLKRSDRAMAD
ncbi:MAG: L,D-transpeptidase family protein [Caulobacterales bacterium]|nr:L,D-transpeptidase family protein [Caulobacterales bacterium]